MTRLDDGWNLVKLHGGRDDGNVDGDNGDPMTSKSQLSIDIISDDYNVDDDILSNTSSDDYAELSNSLRSKKVTLHPSHHLEGSFETLTGSVANQGCPPAQQESRSRRSRIKNFLVRTFAFGEEAKVDAKLQKLCHSNMFSNSKLKIWHVIALTSLLSMCLFIGMQNYSPIFSSLVKNVPSMAQSSNNDASSNNEMIYGNINFLNHRESNLLSTWKPTGKYYVDFDNHIAYPIEERDLIGWQKYKTDIVILWHTTRVKLTRVWRANIIPSSKNLYERIANLVNKDARELANILSSVRVTLSVACNSLGLKLKSKSISFSKSVNRASQKISQCFHMAFQTYQKKTLKGLKARRHFKKYLSLTFFRRKGMSLKQKYHQLSLDVRSDIHLLKSTWKKGKKAANIKYREKFLPNFKKNLFQGSNASKMCYQKVTQSFEDDFSILQKRFKAASVKGLYPMSRSVWAREKLNVKHFVHKRWCSIAAYKTIVDRGISNLRNLAAQMLKNFVAN